MTDAACLLCCRCQPCRCALASPPLHFPSLSALPIPPPRSTVPTFSLPLSLLSFPSYSSPREPLSGGCDGYSFFLLSLSQNSHSTVHIPPFSALHPAYRVGQCSSP
ncbi:hypothetical protein BO86DRAFT_390902 [Aspergillus japonicus CBS 114.51]|uniref:Uncharacterized protein n=1 Tax=Aspergillus japonicus CBS 114.51 TaxID=1448312 RepID=A0A8T8WUQ6_ASPJA|nr:hypothetical protein BO86DRAFT_390902 [Aspergillus japonicus CBS 114.51]RAH79513.1 hypothetical protein BO86DRAFT_390902 [Aspergillus japonicus CBS 114.51]